MMQMLKKVILSTHSALYTNDNFPIDFPPLGELLIQLKRFNQAFKFYPGREKDFLRNIISNHPNEYPSIFSLMLSCIQTDSESEDDFRSIVVSHFLETIEDMIKNQHKFEPFSVLICPETLEEYSSFLRLISIIFNFICRSSECS